MKKIFYTSKILIIGFLCLAMFDISFAATAANTSTSGQVIGAGSACALDQNGNPITQQEINANYQVSADLSNGTASSMAACDSFGSTNICPLTAQNCQLSSCPSGYKLTGTTSTGVGTCTALPSTNTQCPSVSGATPTYNATTGYCTYTPNVPASSSPGSCPSPFTGCAIPQTVTPTALQQQIIWVYMAYFDVIPDLGGLNYWVGRVQQDCGGQLLLSGLTPGTKNVQILCPSVLDSMVNSAITDGEVNTGITTVESNPTQDIINGYQNQFNRTPSQTEINDWLTGFNNGSITIYNLPVMLLSDAENISAQDITVDQNKLQTTINGTLALSPQLTTDITVSNYNIQSSAAIQSIVQYMNAPGLNTGTPPVQTYCQALLWLKSSGFAVCPNDPICSISIDPITCTVTPASSTPSTPSCLSPYTYNPSTGQCQVAAIVTQTCPSTNDPTQQATLNSSGQCVYNVTYSCSLGSNNPCVYSNGTTAVNNLPSNNLQAYPTEQVDSSQCNTISAQQCPNGGTPNSQGVCTSNITNASQSCASIVPGATYNSSIGACVTPGNPGICPAPGAPNASGYCTVSLGANCSSLNAQSTYSNGMCVVNSSCSSGQIVDNGTNTCAVTPSTCPSGGSPDSSGVCSSSQTQSCNPSNLTLTGSGSSATCTGSPSTCPSGGSPNSSGVCTTSSTLSCPPSSTGSTSLISVNGVTLCSTSYSKTCNSPYYMQNGQCVYSPSPSCYGSYYYNGSQCVMSWSCPSGSYQTGTFSSGLICSSNPTEVICPGYYWNPEYEVYPSNNSPGGIVGYSSGNNQCSYYLGPQSPSLWQLLFQGQSDLEGYYYWSTTIGISRSPTYSQIQAVITAGYNNSVQNICGESVSSMSTNPTLAAEVMAAYVWYLGRCPDSGGWNYWYVQDEWDKTGGLSKFEQVAAQNNVPSQVLPQYSVYDCAAGYTYNNGYCVATPQIYCPSGMSQSGGTCVNDDYCPYGGLYNGSQCYMPPSYICPSPGGLSGTTCYYTPSPSCPSGYTYNTTSGTCTVTPSPSCPSGYTYNSSTGQCTGSNVCPSGSTYNSSTGQCTGTVITSCPSGYTYNSSTGQCTGSNVCPAPTYSCPNGGTLSGTTCSYTATSTTTSSSYTASFCDMPNCPWEGAYPSSCGGYCDYWPATPGQCPIGSVVPGWPNQCYYTPPSYTADYYCPYGGTLSGTTCYVSNTTYSCPNGGTLSGTTCSYPATINGSLSTTYNPSTKLCDTTTSACPSGFTWNSTLGKCTSNIAPTMSCPTGYVPNSSGTECIGPQVCPLTTTYSTSANACIFPAGQQCPGQYQMTLLSQGNAICTGHTVCPSGYTYVNSSCVSNACFSSTSTTGTATQNSLPQQCATVTFHGQTTSSFVEDDCSKTNGSSPSGGPNNYSVSPISSTNLATGICWAVVPSISYVPSECNSVVFTGIGNEIVVTCMKNGPGGSPESTQVGMISLVDCYSSGSIVLGANCNWPIMNYANGVFTMSCPGSSASGQIVFNKDAPPQQLDQSSVNSTPLNTYNINFQNDQFGNQIPVCSSQCYDISTALNPPASKNGQADNATPMSPTNCNGSIFIFNGSNDTCLERHNFMATGCCDKSTGKLQDSMGGLGALGMIKNVSGTLMTGYKIIQAGSLAYQLQSLQATTSTGTAGGMVNITAAYNPTQNTTTILTANIPGTTAIPMGNKIVVNGVGGVAVQGDTIVVSSGAEASLGQTAFSSAGFASGASGGACYTGYNIVTNGQVISQTSMDSNVVNSATSAATQTTQTAAAGQAAANYIQSMGPQVANAGIDLVEQSMLGGSPATASAAQFATDLGFSIATGQIMNPLSWVQLGMDLYQLGSALFLYQCTPEDITTSTLKASNYCVHVGDYCSNRIFGICASRKQSYCCFDSQLAEIIQYDGRPQLNPVTDTIGCNVPGFNPFNPASASYNPQTCFGSPEEPNCRGFNPQELQMLDFSKINFGPYIQQLSTQIQSYVQSNISSLQQQAQALAPVQQQNAQQQTNVSGTTVTTP